MGWYAARGPRSFLLGALRAQGVGLRWPVVPREPQDRGGEDEEGSTAPQDQIQLSLRDWTVSKEHKAPLTVFQRSAGHDAPPK